MGLEWTFRRLALAVPVVWMVALVACSSGDESAPVTVEQQIQSRAEARWAALAAGDFRGAYDFESPAYKEITSFERFRGNFGSQVAWHGATAKEVEVKDGGDVAVVLLLVEYTAPLPTGELQRMRRGMKETWILGDDGWSYLRQ